MHTRPVHAAGVVVLQQKLQPTALIVMQALAAGGRAPETVSRMQSNKSGKVTPLQLLSNSLVRCYAQQLAGMWGIQHAEHAAVMYDRGMPFLSRLDAAFQQHSIQHIFPLQLLWEDASIWRAAILHVVNYLLQVCI